MYEEEAFQEIINECEHQQQKQSIKEQFSDIASGVRTNKDEEEITFVVNNIMENILSGVNPRDIAFVANDKRQLNKIKEALDANGIDPTLLALSWDPKTTGQEPGDD